MIARGSLGNPWIFEELTGARDEPPAASEIVAELRWVLDRAAEHWGPERAARNLRKFYPWYLERLGFDGPDADALPADGEPRRGPRAARESASIGRSPSLQRDRLGRVDASL